MSHPAVYCPPNHIIAIHSPFYLTHILLACERIKFFLLAFKTFISPFTLQSTILGKIEFEGDPVEFHNPNKRNLMGEVSTKVAKRGKMKFRTSLNVLRVIRNQKIDFEWS